MAMCGASAGLRALRCAPRIRIYNISRNKYSTQVLMSEIKKSLHLIITLINYRLNTNQLDQF
jgi:hypothetical protein